MTVSVQGGGGEDVNDRGCEGSRENQRVEVK